jgi:zinc transport system substrate-binding protein
VEVGGQEPSSRELANILRLAREKGATVILAQPEFSTRAAHVIASQVGGRVILLSPLAEDWMANMKAATSAIKDALWNGVVE